MNRRQTGAIAELGFAAALWGFGFIAAIWAMEAIGFLSLTALRFIIAAVVCSLWAAAVGAKNDLLDRKQFLMAFWPGVFLTLTLILQTWGLTYTTATKSGFITCLYILFVPVLEAWYFKKRLSPWHFFFVFTALAGIALICEFETGSWNKGDLLTFGCTIMASFQIFYFALIADRIRSSIAFNALQSLWAFTLPAVLALAFEQIPQGTFTTKAWIGILAISLGSSSLAFLFQIRAQKVISPSTASLLYLLESPFAMIFAVAFLSEKLSLSQWMGVAVVVASVAAATRVTSERLPHS